MFLKISPSPHQMEGKSGLLCLASRVRLDSKKWNRRKKKKKKGGKRGEKDAGTARAFVGQSNRRFYLVSCRRAGAAFGKEGGEKEGEGRGGEGGKK